jgi:hypothetical protein
VKPSGSGFFCDGRLLITKSMSLVGNYMFTFFYFSLFYQLKKAEKTNFRSLALMISKGKQMLSVLGKVMIWPGITRLFRATSSFSLLELDGVEWVDL